MSKRKQACWLSDGEWAAIEPHLPRGRSGARRVDDRRVVSGIVHMLRSGTLWRDCPLEYGLYTTIYNHFNRWREQGTGASTRLTSRRTAQQAAQKGGSSTTPSEPRVADALRISTP